MHWSIDCFNDILATNVHGCFLKRSSGQDRTSCIRRARFATHLGTWNLCL